MAELKTKKTKVSVSAFLKAMPEGQRKKDALRIHEIMAEVTDDNGVMWGPSIVGYGNVHLVYESGRELDWMAIGFSPRKQNLVLYLMNGFKNYDVLLQKLGKHKSGGSCLYLNKLEDVDEKVLRQLITDSYNYVIKKHAVKK